ncbi:MAG: HIT domain-containing protein [Anaerolineae bacterium]|nr:HIT domain-containing protein [Anaerolineae bacterium]
MTTTQPCMTCELIDRRDRGEAPPWDMIHRADHWDLVHAYNTSLPGWLVLVARRHVAAIDELTEEEATELGVLLRRSSAALRQVVGCVKTYVCQFAEQAEHPHVHFHIVPRMADQPDDRRGPRVFGYLGVPEDERVSEEKMNEIAAGVGQYLATNNSNR